MVKILVVDDSLVDQRMAGKLLETCGEIDLLDRSVALSVSYAGNGVEALQVIERDLPDVVLTDLQMPQMDGLALVDEIKARHPRLPVILMTAHGSEDIAIEALRVGASSYVPKRNLATELVHTVEDVLIAASTHKEKQRLVDECWLQSSCNFLLPNDLAYIPPLVTHLQENLTRLQICEEHDLIRVAVALREALNNAILHGNLEIDSELRETDEKAFWEMREKRSQQEPFKSRSVYVTSEESRTEAVYLVRDEGRGFDPNSLPDPTADENLDRVSGRGLFLIRTFMDYTEFNSAGNEIKMIKRRS